MIVFIAVLVISALILALLFKYKSQIPSANKKILGFLVLVLALLIGLYNFMQEKESEFLSTLKLAFAQGQEIECEFNKEQIIITKDEFNLINGTMSFIGKPDSKLSGTSIELSHCKVSDK